MTDVNSASGNKSTGLNSLPPFWLGQTRCGLLARIRFVVASRSLSHNCHHRWLHGGDVQVALFPTHLR